MSTTNLILKQLPRYPAKIFATNGIKITVEDGINLVITPDFSNLVPVPAVTNPTMTYFMAWDRSINYYQSISFQDFADNLAEQVLEGTLVALRNVTFGANQGVYFSDANTANAYNLSSFVRGISGSADAASFKTSLSLVKADVGLANVDNTSDASKPVSTAQQTALNLKANLASPALTGTPTAPTAAAATNTTQIATTAMVQSAVTASLTNLPFSKEYISAEQTITVAGLLTLAHGLGVAPKMIAPVLICKTAENGYSVGDIIPASTQTSTSTLDSYGASFEYSGATNILVRYGSGSSGNVFIIPHKTTGVPTTATTANWRLIMRAWA